MELGVWLYSAKAFFLKFRMLPACITIIVVCVCVCVCVCVYSVGHVLKAQSIAKSFIVHFYCLKVSDPSLERYLVVTSSE